MMMLQRKQQRASALLMVILLIVLMVSLAISFMSIVSKQRGTAVMIACQTKASVVVDMAYAHAVRSILEEFADTSRSYMTYLNARWREEFRAVNDPDNDPFTEDGLPQRMSQGTCSHNELVNASYRYQLHAMLGLATDNSSSGHIYDSNMSSFWGLADKWMPKSGRPYMRWHNAEYLDDHLQVIEIPDSSTEIERAKLRRSARYVVRYACSIMDLNGFKSINNNFPGAPLSEGDPNYFRFQNYLKTYGRSIKSQVASGYNRSSYGYQFRSDDQIDDSGIGTYDPLDVEPLNYFADGEYHQRSSSTYNNYGLWRDWRIRMERTFRGEPLKWVQDAYGYSNYKNKTDKFDILLQSQKGPVVSYASTSMHFNSYYYSGIDAYLHTPYGDSMLDSALSGTDEVSVPWRVNLLTATPYTFNQMILGLSSEIRFYQKKISNGVYAANADLFGRNYPEAFPLQLDDGKDVPLYGESFVENTKNYNSDLHVYGNRGETLGPELYGGEYFIAHEAAVNSYWLDAVDALGGAIAAARRVWTFGWSLGSGNETSYDNGSVVVYKNNMNPSYIDPNETDADKMLEAIIREFYRIIGEGQILDEVPARSVDFYDASKPSLLAGGRTFVGRGFRGSDKTEYLKMSELSPMANTRGMEYLLNDLMISLFGKANPYWQPGMPLEHIAVDFNDDGYAESTVTGWWDASRGERVWSWWWDGLGPYAQVDHDFMKRDGWYRFYQDGSINRFDGSNWVPLTGAARSDFESYNDIWLTGDSSAPIKPFSKTGRFFIGKSRIFQVFVRGEVYNLDSRETMAAQHRAYIYRVDPNKDSDASDSFTIMQKDFTARF